MHSRAARGIAGFFRIIEWQLEDQKICSDCTTVAAGGIVDRDRAGYRMKTELPARSAKNRAFLWAQTARQL
jgi:hypothetical protein